MKHRITALLTSAVMTGFLLPFSASAADLTLQAPTLTAARGEPVCVQIMLKGNPGFDEINFAFSYDEELTPVLNDSGDLQYTSGFEGLDLAYCNDYDACIAYGFVSAETIRQNGMLATFWLTVPRDAEPGTVYTLDFEPEAQCAGLRGAYTDPVTVSGCITVSDAPRYGLGDVNADGKLSVSDAVLLARIVAEDLTVTVTPEGADNAEIDGETGLSADDISLLLKLLAGTFK